MEWINYILKADYSGIAKNKISFQNVLLFFAAVLIVASLVDLAVQSVGQIFGAIFFGNSAGAGMAAIMTGIGGVMTILMIPIGIVFTLIVSVFVYGFQFLIATLLGGKCKFEEFIKKMIYLFTATYAFFWAIGVPFAFLLKIFTQDTGIATDISSMSLGAIFVVGIISVLIIAVQLIYSLYMETMLTSKLMGISARRAFVSVIVLPIIILTVLIALAVLIIGLFSMPIYF